LLVSTAKKDYLTGNAGGACRKYEEAYSIWRYYYSSNPKWDKEGIEDFHLREVDWQGNNEQERKMILQIKIDCLLNIAACAIKTQCYDEALASATEALKVDPKNQRAFWRRAKARAAPINAGVPDFRLAVKDLANITDQDKKVASEMARLKKLVSLNSKREHNTYKNMFIRKENEEAVNDFVEREEAKAIKFRSLED